MHENYLYKITGVSFSEKKKKTKKKLNVRGTYNFLNEKFSKRNKRKN